MFSAAYLVMHVRLQRPELNMNTYVANQNRSSHMHVLRSNSNTHVTRELFSLQKVGVVSDVCTSFASFY
jgi:hypothetical protein